MKTVVEELREAHARARTEVLEALARAALAEHERDGAIARAEAAEAALQALRVPLHRFLWCVETWEGGHDTEAKLRALVPQGCVAEPAPAAEGGDRG